MVLYGFDRHCTGGPYYGIALSVICLSVVWRPSMRPLSLHQLTILDAPPPRLVEIAGELGCQHVCLFVRGMEDQDERFPAIKNAAAAREVLDRCKSTGISVYNLEIFPLVPGVDVEAFRPALERGALLGGQRATALVDDPEPNRAIDTFTAFCELTQSYGIKAGVEFMAFTVTKRLEDAIAVVTRAGHPNGSVALDILHLMRNGGHPRELVKMTPRLWGYIQICDGPLDMAPEKQLSEALEGRLVPGEGAFPLREFVSALPPHAPISMEAPLLPVPAPSMSPLERARRVVEGTRRILRASETGQG